jgi:hypothetical protein
MGIVGTGAYLFGDKALSLEPGTYHNVLIVSKTNHATYNTTYYHDFKILLFLMIFLIFCEAAAGTIPAPYYNVRLKCTIDD